MNPIAEQLNEILKKENPYIFEMLSNIGKNLFFPKGILAQSAEAKQKAHKINATIGIATEKGRTMHLPSIMGYINDIKPEDSLTYAPSFGIPALRKAWQESIYTKNPSISGTNISLPVVTCGITHGIATLADLWVDPSDAIILPDMMWGNYNMIFNVRKGATITNYQLFDDKGGINISAFEKKLREEASKKNKIIVLLNFPHNPSGYTASKNEAKEISNILIDIAEKGTNVIVICDDSYFGLFYEEETFKESIFSLICGKSDRLLAIKLDGATKENFAWGLRVGFITYGCKFKSDYGASYDALERKTAGCIRGTISNASHLSQSIVLKSIQNKNYLSEKGEKSEILSKRAHLVKSTLLNAKYKDVWEAYPFNSGYFMCIKLKVNIDAEKLRVHLLDKYGVGLISFGKDNLRVAFSSVEEEDIPVLFDIILQGINDLT
ncbi:MAG: aminotransferase class I/II-fold pyridoxal phosphate-dependent enzyme [Desulfobacterales bacterium]|nr:aminotransferase class I/II-fold pyridoxal phosphate-dependent enzyme [Desulfobacterales bacterium]